MRGLVLALLAFIVLFVGGFLAVGEFVYDYSFGVHRFPIIIGVITIALALAAAIRVAAARRGAAPARGADAESGPVRTEAVAGDGEPAVSAWPPGTTRALAWLVAALPVMILCGYVAGAALYLLAYLKLHGERWLTAVTFAATAALVVYFGFYEFLSVRLPVAPFWWPE